MAEHVVAQPPLHALLEQLEAWRADPSEPVLDSVRTAFGHVLDAYGLRGGHIVVSAPPMPMFTLGAGSLRAGPAAQAGRSNSSRLLHIGRQSDRGATLWIDGPEHGAALVADALELLLSAVWSREDAEFRGAQLAALDAAVRGIAGELSLQRVLQLIVDRVRELVAAEYAALAIVGPFGNIEQFVTSGLSDEIRKRIGPLPRGHGLLGLIIREGRPLVIDDIATDPRRHGFPPHHPEMHSFIGTPIRSKGQTIGNLYLTNKSNNPTFSEADLRLIDMFSLHAGIAMENARLLEDVQRLAIVDERERISRDLHDSIIQRLYGISLSLEDLPEVMAEEPNEGIARADHAIDSINGTIRDIRNFIFGLQPEMLEQSDLPAGMETLAADFRMHTLIDLVVLLSDDLRSVPQVHAEHILAITREGLSNIARHSGATRASVELDSDGGHVRLTISDNGEGFDPAQPRSRSQRGLANLTSRAESVGGTLALASEPGIGTRVVAQIPVKADG